MKSLLILPILLLLTASLQGVPASEQKRPEVGKPAPALRLNDHRGELVELGGKKGTNWTVLAFFPKAATPG
jgi:hypothetical protein